MLPKDGPVEARQSDQPAGTLAERLERLSDQHPSSPRYSPPRDSDLHQPQARDVIRNVESAGMDPRKLSEYAMNPEHPQNNGKSLAWAALGYEVANPDRRREAASELADLICAHLLPEGLVTAVKETAGNTDYRVQSGLTGPNGRHATLVTCWRAATGEQQSGPRLLTAWLKVHKDRT